MFPQIFGKYVLERELAAGGMARVYLATLRGAGGFEKRLVLKQIRPELCSDQSFIERFVAEAKVAVELSHANIVPVYELGVEQDSYYIAMELCEGVSLAELLLSGPLSPNQGAYVAVEVCRALDYAHRKAGIVHSDVTPRNVMIDAEGMVRLIDFGVAAPSRTAPGEAHVVFGSLGHMPPEQMRGEPLAPAADVFAVAVLLYESWLGEPPYRRDTLEATQQAMRGGPPALGQKVSALAALCPLLERAVAAEVTARPQSAEELARPLRDFLRSVDLGDLARTLGDRVRRSQRTQEQARLGQKSSPSDASLGGGGLRVPHGSHEGASGATQSFAVSRMLQQWTAPQAAEPSAAPDSARQLAEQDSRSDAAELPTTQPLHGTDAASGVGLERGAIEPRIRSARRDTAIWTLACIIGGALLWWEAPFKSPSPLDGAGRSTTSTASTRPSHEPPLPPLRRRAPDGDDDSRAVAAEATRASPVDSRPNPRRDRRGARSDRETPRSAPADDSPHSETASTSRRSFVEREPRAREVAKPHAGPSLVPIHKWMGTNAVASGGRNSAAKSPSAGPSPSRAQRSERHFSPGTSPDPAKATGPWIRVTAEPSASVSIDDRPMGTTPLDVRLRRGAHEFVFYSELLGERVSARIVSQPNQRVHADFTTAAPSVRVR